MLDSKEFHSKKKKRNTQPKAQKCYSQVADTDHKSFLDSIDSSLLSMKWETSVLQDFPHTTIRGWKETLERQILPFWANGPLAHAELRERRAGSQLVPSFEDTWKQWGRFTHCFQVACLCMTGMRGGEVFGGNHNYWLAVNGNQKAKPSGNRRLNTSLVINAIQCSKYSLSLQSKNFFSYRVVLVKDYTVLNFFFPLGKHLNPFKQEKPTPLFMPPFS